MALTATIDDTKRAVGRRKRSVGHVQARGETRRKILLNTAFTLVQEKAIEDITYPEIARRADIPLASCYHFFPGKMELFAELIDYAGPWHRYVTVAALLQPADGWTDIFEHLSTALINAYEGNPAFLQLFSTWKIPGTVYAGREAGIREAADRLRQGIDRQFIRPQFEAEVEVFLYAARISETIWRASMEECGRVSDFARREAQCALLSYLYNYVPPHLDRRLIPIEMPLLTLPELMPDIVRATLRKM